MSGFLIAFGHPFAATGARILAVLAKLLHNQGGRRGLISVCTAGGMGVAVILEGVATTQAPVAAGRSEEAMGVV